MKKPDTKLEAQQKTGYIFASIATFCLALTAIFIRELSVTYKIPSLVIAFWRNLLAISILFVFLLIFKRDLLKLERVHLPFMMLFGLGVVLFNLFWTLSVVANGPSIATVIAYSSVPFTALMAYWFMRESVRLPKIIAIVITLIGCAMVSLTTTSIKLNMGGLLIGLLSGLTYATYTLLSRKAGQKGINPWTAFIYSFFFGTLFMGLVNLFPLKFIPGQAATPSAMILSLPAMGWVLLVGLAVISTIIGFGAYNTSLVHLPASTANMVLTLEPIITAVFAFFLFNERLSGTQLFGGLLVVAAVLWIRWYEGQMASRQKLKLASNN
ncbi:MAG TPA: DMT family transporter [Anaerolineaceae bacterium]|nr:DMT family transporter [Anaerolineaceae bacterium]